MTAENNKLFLGLGLVCIFGGVILNEWVLAFFLSTDGVIDPTARAAIWVADVLLISFGLLVIVFRDRLHFDLFREGGKSLQYILIGGIALRIIVYIFLRPENNDPHLEVVEFIVANGTLPTSEQLVLSWHPPLYYLMAAPLAAIGSAKLVQILSLMLSIGNFCLLYYLIKTTSLLKQFRTRAHVLLLTALLPQFVIFGNFISNDALAFFVGSLVFLQVFRYIEQPTRKNLYLLAIVCGIGLLTKGSFLAFLPVVFGVVVVIELRAQKTWAQKMAVLGIFCAVTGVVGGYKFVENTVHLGKPLMSIEDDTQGLHSWVYRQPKTYQGIESIIDFNLVKLVNHPFLSEHTVHSVPLLLYSTFWYSYIPESNFNATRDYPFSVLPRAMYVVALLPTALIVVGASYAIWQNRMPLKHFKSQEPVFRLHLKQTVIVSLLLMNLMVVLVWGLKHNAFSFFQGRLLFPSFFAVAMSFGWGLEGINDWRSGSQPFLDIGLSLTYALFICYFVVETGTQLI